MTTETQHVLESIQDSARKISGIDATLVGNEIALLSERLEELSRRPPSLKTADFKHPVGKEVAFEEIHGEQATFERIIDESDLLPVWFLEQGAQMQRSVARVVLTQPHAGFPPGTGWATGFLVSPTLLLTNNHVIPDQAFSAKIRMQFNFQLGADGIEQPTESFFPVVDGAFHTNAALDYTLIRLRANPGGANGTVVNPGDNWGFVPMNPNPIFRDKQHLNIVQHPAGRRKEVALQNNEVDRLFENAVRYKADTEPGSSGSAVFNNLWQLIALHHAGGDFQNGKWINNEGIRLDRISEDLRAHFEGTDQAGVLTELGI